MTWRSDADEWFTGKACVQALPARLADLYIERLRRADFDPFDPRVRTKPRWPMLRLTAARLRQCF
ncbi:MAG: hypothetical protein U1E43_06180 [Rhodospirillales bacterium]